MSAVPVIAIDGPGGSGKGTVASSLASTFDWHYLDSGALYRLVAVAAIARAVPLEAASRLARLVADLDIQFDARAQGALSVRLDGRAVGAEIRTEAAAAAASQVAVLPAVRAALLSLQRRFRQPPGLVADGRDMGTVVFPDAGCKVFLTAAAEERANRRHKQLKEKGIDVNLAALLADIQARDQRDMNRPVAPLIAANDAVVIDTTRLSVAAVIRLVREIAAKKLNLVFD